LKLLLLQVWLVAFQAEGLQYRSHWLQPLAAAPPAQHHHQRLLQATCLLLL
jgi:hypothetical protein